MKKYKIIYSDPAWKFKYYGKSDDRYRRAEGHYKVSTLEEMKKIPVQNLADDNCVLFMWAIYPMLPHALELMKSWGFKFKTIAFTWVKKNKTNNDFFFGMGYWTRANCEICLLGTKGKPKRVDSSVPQLVIANRREHSRKPDEVRERIVKLLGDLPRIELFARERVEGWDAWGNEVPNEQQNILSNSIVPPSNSPTASANAENIISVKEENQK